MTYSYVLKSGETWESTHLPMDTPWVPAEGGDCVSCLTPIVGEAYEYHDGSRNQHYCVRHYKDYADRIEDKLPVSLARPWFTMEAWKKGWRPITPKLSAALTAAAAAQGRIISAGGLYPEIREVSECTSIQGPQFDELLVTFKTSSFSLEWHRAYFMFSHNQRNFYTMLPCVVCGRGGSLSDHGIGFFHPACWVWFLHDGAAEAEGIIKHPCGHYSRPVVADDYACLDCGERITSGSCSWCNTFDASAPRCEVHAALHSNRVVNVGNEGIAAARIDAGFNLFAALADFYILSDLHDRAPALVEPEYVRRVQEIANEMARYTIMATGGEARHWSERSAHDWFCVAQLKEGEQIDPERDTMHCVYCQTEKLICEPTNHPRYKVVHYHGLDSDEAHACAAPKKLRASCTKSMLSVKIDGVTHQCQSSIALWTPLKLYTDKVRGDRTRAWGAYSKRFRELGLPVLDTCVTMFDTGSWAGSFGGKKWARAARLVRDYVKGDLNPPVFVDSIFGVQHNGGSLFNKVYLMKLQNFTLRELLDVRRVMQSSLVLLPWASPATRWQWVATAFETHDPELMLGVNLWIEAVKDGSVTLDSFRRVLHEYSLKRSPRPLLPWDDEAKKFRLKQSDRPKWRKTVRKSRVKKVVAVEKMAVLAGVTA